MGSICPPNVNISHTQPTVAPVLQNPQGRCYIIADTVAIVTSFYLFIP